MNTRTVKNDRCIHLHNPHNSFCLLHCFIALYVYCVSLQITASLYSIHFAGLLFPEMTRLFQSNQ